MRSTLSLLCSIGFYVICHNAVLTAQTFGGLKPNLHFAQINTDTVRIIFPKHMQADAQRVANTVHYLRKYHTDQIGDQAFKIDILLNNQTTVSNGFVSIAPWKSHFVTTPLQSSYQLTSLPWLDLLSLHEYRHVIQLSTARRGITRLLYYLFGQESWAGAANLSIPGWFTEGDAVWAETEQSSQGRGRIPAFQQGYRALKSEGLKYRYDKVRNGSLKDFVPDHYRLGYLLVDYGYEQYGGEFWRKVMVDAAAYKGVFYPFSKAMKRHGGLSPKQMYDTVWNQLAYDHRPFHDELPDNPIVVPAEPLKRFVDYQQPHLVGDSLLVYFERSFDKIGYFKAYHLQAQKTTTLIKKGISIDTYMSGNGQKLTWTEYSTNPRWVEDDYTNIIKYDISSKQKSKVTTRGKYFSPHITTDGLRIIAVKTTPNTASSLCLLDGNNGELIKEMAHPGWTYTYPKFGADENFILTAVRDANGLMALVEIDVSTGQERIIVPFLNRIVGIPEVKDSMVYYSTSTKDKENIFATHLSSGHTIQCTDEPNGAFQVTAGSSQLYYVTFTSQGHVIKITDRSNSVNRWDQPSMYEIEYGQNLLDSIPSTNYEVKPYRPLTKSLNIHTWGFIVEDPNLVARVLSNNILNNVELSAGIKYNYDEQNYRPFASVSIAALYPTIDLEVNQVNRSLSIDGQIREWTETNAFGGLSIDYNLMSGTYLRSLEPSIGINHATLRGDLDLSITSIASQITFQQQQIKARKNIFTHSGQYLQLRYSTAIDDFLAEQIQVRAGLALPGFGQNHNLILEADMKSDLEDGEYQFSSGFNHRGYGVVPGQDAFRCSADYHFPLCYPDRGIAGLVYFYRMRLNPFYEYSSVSSLNVAQTFQSVGAELVFDMNMVNEVPLSLGFRFSYPLHKSFTPSYEFFIPIYRF